MQICKEHTTDLTADRQKVKYIHTYVFMYVGMYICICYSHALNYYESKLQLILKRNELVHMKSANHLK